MICFISILFFSLSSTSYSMFKTSDCVGQSFQGKFSIEKGPFGLLPLNMSVKKNRCIVDIVKKFVFESSWQIDLCREPVHIKRKSWSGDGFDLRKSYPCKEDKAYCQIVDELITSIENDALIYAQGERETLGSDHGKFYCTYLLLKSYLKDAKVFSLTVPSSINIFQNTPLENMGIQEQQAAQTQFSQEENLATDSLKNPETVETKVQEKAQSKSPKEPGTVDKTPKTTF